jgi:hypothetical protein
MCTTVLCVLINRGIFTLGKKGSSGFLSGLVDVIV